MKTVEATSSFATLAKVQYAALVTFRKSGDPVATPVWFAERQGVIYVQSAANAGKVKRLRHTARATLAACTYNGQVTGPAIACQGRVIEDEQERALAEQMLARKYGLVGRIYFGVMKLLRLLRRRPAQQSAYLALEEYIPHTDTGGM